MSNTLATFVSYESEKQHNDYLNEVKKNNVNIIGSGSESPLEVGNYKGIVQGGKDSKMRLTGTTNGNSWALFLLSVKVKGGNSAGIIDRIPFNPDNVYKKGNVLNFEIYLDKNSKRRGRITE